MSDFETKLKKLSMVDREEGYKLVYQWVKTGAITYKEFYSLVNNISAI